ncbi:hypothetical protein [Flavobacterium sp.]|uniref:hypothetical protein n=1 Tax=Flavobacterium sp. TaxID=239 RepID=UPI0037525158
MKKYFIIALVLFTLLSCSKEEGYGGLASISGKIFGKDFNSNGVLVNDDYIGGIKVYISKHGESAYFDSMDSAYNGSFKFKNLYAGKYDLWVFGDCDSCAWDQVYKLITVEISKKEDKVVNDIEISF